LEVFACLGFLDAEEHGASPKHDTMIITILLTNNKA
jgi:hypothetical protein